VTDARRDIFNLVKRVQNGDAVTIISKDGNAVLVSEDEWNGIKETLYLLSIPDMLKSMIRSSGEDVSVMERWEKIRDRFIGPFIGPSLLLYPFSRFVTANPYDQSFFRQ